ncbi:iron complex transport system substrate-binding protein [Paenibacillus tianmuensis]|uniref:Iron complex transport system substrate-binding protein n=1 Tax=Paenibacillus tianmuensis TaxID=624147 RepID=A0A1G4R9P2_9BACL|nr:helix-turn-helix domain-containing protein [Paenibacillus tianmuensis]SCW53371.1 iron complex transport system substrate-binding protein [Paenibacillus tianmuensis]
MIELRKLQEQPERMPRSISFALLNIEQFDSDSPQTMNSFRYSLNYLTLIVMIRGSLHVEADDMKADLHPGELLSLVSTADIQLNNTTARPFACYIISYAMQRTGDWDNLDDLGGSGSFLPHQDLWKAPWQRLSRGLEQLCKNRWSSDPLQQLANHMHFQEWMMFIFTERNFHRAKEHDSKKAVEHALDYMHAAYHEDITVDKLAAKARLSRRQFTELFRKLTNRSVSGYLTDLRIQEAKKLLLAGGQLSYIAQTVGYRDEFYFNRRFKQIVGQSPRQYAQNKQRLIRSFTLASSPQRIVADQYMGQLLKLGVIPVGARTEMLRKELAAAEKSSSSLQGIVDLGKGFPISLPRVSGLQPDLIVTQNEHQYQQLEQIAPTLLIPYQSTSPLEKLRLIGGVLNKTDLAEQWIEDYEWRIEQTRAQIVSKLGLGYFVTNLLLLNGQLYVLGQHAGYGSFSLYQALQLQAPPLQRRELDEASLSIKIPFSALPAYAGDHIFISVYGDPSTLTESGIWQSLPAVKNRRVYFINPYRFAFEDPYSLDEQLQVISSILTRQL